MHDHVSPARQPDNNGSMIHMMLQFMMGQQQSPPSITRGPEFHADHSRSSSSHVDAVAVNQPSSPLCMSSVPADAGGLRPGVLQPPSLVQTSAADDMRKVRDEIKSAVEQQKKSAGKKGTKNKEPSDDGSAIIDKDDSSKCSETDDEDSEQLAKGSVSKKPHGGKALSKDAKKHKKDKKHKKHKASKGKAAKVHKKPKLPKWKSDPAALKIMKRPAAARPPAAAHCVSQQKQTALKVGCETRAGELGALLQI